MSQTQPRTYDPIAVSAESTVVSEYPAEAVRAEAYQTEAQLEHELIRTLESQAYEHLPLNTEADLIANLRTQLEALKAQIVSGEIEVHDYTTDTSCPA